MEKEMNEKSRTEKVAVNAVVNTTFQLLTFLLNFINRTIFIRIFGIEYLGVNGLFTNILSLLSLAELGIGGAITFHLYKPLSEKNEDELKKLIKIYSSIYKFIGMTVMAIGLMLIPFLFKIVGDVPDITENIYLIYVLFLMDTSISYFNVYKSTLITADQKDYINVSIRQTTTIIMMVLRLIVTRITKNYWLYLIMQLLNTIVINILITNKANKLYPFIKDSKNTKVDRVKLKEIFIDTKSIILYKIGGTILDSTDNILISALLGVAVVGYASNYTMIIIAVTTIFNQIINAFTASVGNLNTEDDAEHSKRVFYNFLFICFWIYSFGGTMLVTLTNDLINVWLGQEYVLGISVIIGLVFSFYIKGIQIPAWMYRSTLGLFKQGRYAPIMAAIINIFLSILLCGIMGVGGIFLATGISRMITTGIVDPILIYKNKFKGNCLEYFKKLLYYFIIFVGMGSIIYAIGEKIIVNNFGNLIIKTLLLCVGYNLVFIFWFKKNAEYNNFIQTAKNIIVKPIRKVIR